MRSVSVTSAGAFSDTSAINGALENLDSAIDQFADTDGGDGTVDGGETSSNCSSGLTVYRKPPSTVVVPVKIVVHEPTTTSHHHNCDVSSTRPPSREDNPGAASLCDNSKKQAEPGPVRALSRPEASTFPSKVQLQRTRVGSERVESRQK